MSNVTPAEIGKPDPDRNAPDFDIAVDDQWRLRIYQHT
jgi:hypothetical protein